MILTLSQKENIINQIAEIYRKSKMRMDYLHGANRIRENLTTYENAFEVVKRVDAAINICSRLTQLIIIHRFLELSESDWYVGYMTRNTYYRYREKAINEFFDALEL